MMTSSLLALYLLVAAGQAVADHPADQLLKGCGYSSESGVLTEVRWGLFQHSRPPFADGSGFSVQVSGQWVHPDNSPYPKGEGRPWFDQNAAITFDGRRYVKDSLPMVFGIDEVRLAGQYDGLPVAVGAPLAPQPTGAILILVDPTGCGFQRYLPA